MTRMNAFLEHDPAKFYTSLTICPDSEAFRAAYQMGREDYFDTCKGEPRRARTMSVEQVMGLVATRDASGVYQFDEAVNLAEEIIGFTLGYMGGAFLPETPEERERREHRYGKPLPIAALQQA